MEIAIQIADFVAVIVAGLQKNKTLAQLFYFIDNIVLTIMFFIFGRYSTAIICFVAMIRSLVFYVFSTKKIKPNIFILLFFEIAYLVITIVTWQDALDLLPLFGTLASTYTSWQDNVSLMRIGYIINPIFYIIYKLIIGAYISLITEIVLLISNLFALIYYDILKKEKPILSYLGIFKNKEKKIEES